MSLADYKWKKTETESIIHDILSYKKDKHYYNLSIITKDLVLITLSGDNINAYPFLVTRKSLFDQIAIYVNFVNASGKLILGVYKNIQGYEPYPGDLLLDAGVINIANTGLQSIDINLNLDKGLYWLCFLTNTNPELYATDKLSSFNILSYATLNSSPKNSVNKSYTYPTNDKLPDPFPKNANYVFTHCPIFLRYVHGG